jgi:hypothetical protein
MDAFFHLTRLVRRARQHQIARQLRLEASSVASTCVPKSPNLLRRAHLDGQRHRARPAPGAVGLAVAVEFTNGAGLS